MDRRPLLGLLAFVLLTACTDDGRITQVSPPDSPLGSRITDATVEGGHPVFHWIGPIGKTDRETLGPLFKNFENPADPLISLCELALGNEDVLQCAAPPTTRSAPIVDDHYEVVLKLDEEGLEEGKQYRIGVLADGVELGHADIAVASGKELRNARTGEQLAMNNERALPVKFHIAGPTDFCEFGDADECGIFIVGPEGGTFILESEHAGVLFPEGALDEEVSLLIDRLAVDDDEPCIADIAFPQYEGCFRYRTVPEIEEFNMMVTVAQCIEPAGQNLDRLQLYSIKLEGEFPHGLRKLVNVTPPFTLDCGDFEPALPPLAVNFSGDPVGWLAAAGARALSPVFSRFAPTLLYAKDLGLGGTTISFSTIGWADPWEIVITSGDGQQVAVGAQPAPVVAVIQDAHHQSTTRGNVQVEVELRDPSDEEVETVSLVSDAQGQVSFLPLSPLAEAGTYSVLFRGDAAGPETATATIEAFGGLGSLMLTVTDADTGGPLSGAQVIIADPQLGTLTDVNGIAVLNTVPAGQHDVTVSMIGYDTHQESFWIPAGGTTQGSVELNPQTVSTTGSLTVTVIDASQTTLLEGASVELLEWEQTLITNSSGSVTFSDVEAGFYTLLTTASGFAGDQRSVEIVANSTETETVNLSPDS